MLSFRWIRIGNALKAKRSVEEGYESHVSIAGLVIEFFIRMPE